MSFISVLLCVLLAAAAQTANITKPRLNPTNPKIETTLKPIQKLPEDRRQLPIFPRSSRKFVVTPLVYRKYVTQSPIMLIKKPLMKKMVFQDKRPDIIKIEHTSKRPVMNIKFLSSKPIDLFKKSVQKTNKKRNSDFIDEAAEVNNEKRNGNFYDGDFSVHGDYSEDIASIIYPYNGNNQVDASTPAKVNDKSALKIEDFIFTPKVKPTEAINKDSVLSIEDFIFTPKVKPIEVNTETSTRNPIWSEKNENVSSEEIADRNEFIFLNDKNKLNIMPNVPDEEIPVTEVILALKPRVKRSVNVIEEEYLGTTVSGYMYTNRDTKLSDVLLFKNINS